MHNWKKYPIKTISKRDFPDNLKKINKCPEKLFYRGHWNEKIFEKVLAIVGSRQMTRYGREIISKFMPDLAAEKLTIISGFMYGIDTEAHKKCLEMGGKTIAVLGGGLDFLSPSENDDLYTEILEKDGLVISEYEPDFKPTLWSFPARNRIVSALSTEGILVVEAGLKSGSLITARIGKEQNKKIFAIPGPINSKLSEGTNWLIKENLAKMVLESGDILERQIKKIKQINFLEENLNSIENKIINLLKNEESSIDELTRILGLPITEISTNLSTLSLKDLVEEENGKYYLKN
jgi:DNA processing protein